MANQMSSEPVDVLASRPSRAKRDRSWEKQAAKAQGVVTYRGVPPELNKQIKAIADELGVPVGDVARAFLEHGLKAYRNGTLELTPEIATGRFALYSRESG